MSRPLLAQDVLARRHPHHVGHVRGRRRHRRLFYFVECRFLAVSNSTGISNVMTVEEERSSFKITVEACASLFCAFSPGWGKATSLHSHKYRCDSGAADSKLSAASPRSPDVASSWQSVSGSLDKLKVQHSKSLWSKLMIDGSVSIFAIGYSNMSNKNFMHASFSSLWSLRSVQISREHPAHLAPGPLF